MCVYYKQISLLKAVYLKLVISYIHFVEHIFQQFKYLCHKKQPACIAVYLYPLDTCLNTCESIDLKPVGRIHTYLVTRLYEFKVFTLRICRRRPAGFSFYCEKIVPAHNSYAMYFFSTSLLPCTFSVKTLNM